MHTGILIHFTAFLFLSLFTYRPSRSLTNHPRPTVRPNSIQPGNVHIYGCLLKFNKWHIPQKCTRTSSLMYLCILLLSLSNDIETNPGQIFTPAFRVIIVLLICCKFAKNGFIHLPKKCAINKIVSMIRNLNSHSLNGTREN